MEIFAAAQGEGLLVGIPQIFLRLFRCNLRCAWCDTPESFEVTGKGKIESPPGSRNFFEFENPVSPEKALDLLQPFMDLEHHSISLTGGEPLMQQGFLKKLLPLLKKRKERIFLETGGTLPEIFKGLARYVDFVSMDIKIPSSARERLLWKKHEKFLRLASKKKVYVKIVLTKDTDENELVQALNLVKKVSRNIPVVLQPVTRSRGCLPPSETQILSWQFLALEILLDVRVIPQVHRLMGQK